MIDNYWEFCCGESKLGHLRMVGVTGRSNDIREGPSGEHPLVEVEEIK
jgi:hypothetical protein